MATAGSTHVPNTDRVSVPATILIAGVLIAWFYTQRFLISHSVVLTSSIELAIHPDSPYQIGSYGTALLSHWSLRHLLSNLPGLLFVGGYLELETDSRTLLVTFVTTGLLTLWSYVAICSFVVADAYLLGASPGIYGLFGAVLLYVGLERRNLAVHSVIVFLISLLFVFRQLILLLAGDTMPAMIHLVGAVAGGCAMLLIRYSKQRRILRLTHNRLEK